MMIQLLKLIWLIFCFIVLVVVILYNIITGLGNEIKVSLIDSFKEDVLNKL